MATPKEQHDARSHAMNLGSWRHEADAYDMQQREAARRADAAARRAQRGGGDGDRGDPRESRPADPDVPSSDEP
jgi:hypothetical protein